MDMPSTKPTQSTPTSGPIDAVKRELLASIVVFLVALPLCMGIAIASGAPPAAGLLTGIVGGLITGALAGAPLQVSGPAAGLTVIVYQLISEHGLDMLGVVVLAAGAIQIVAGVLKLGQWFRAVSPAVIHGMLAGIGVLIFSSQFHVMVDDSPKNGGLENLLYIPDAIYKGLVPLDGSPHHWAARIGILTILAVIAWKPLAPRMLKFLPAPLIAVGLATIVAQVANLNVNYVPVPDNLWEAVRWPTWEGLARLAEAPLLTAAVAVAVVASAETLLCATAVDQMHQGPRTRYDRELLAQGVGNTVCGLIGALPMTGVIVRSAANVEAGGKTRLSAILHGVWLLAFVVAAPSLLQMIPTASLAAVLVYTGYKLINPKTVMRLAEVARSEVVIYLATIVTIVVKDLLTGVAVGIALAAAKLLYTFAHLNVRVTRSDGSGRTDIYLNGAATFIRLPKLAAALEAVPPASVLHVHLENLDYIDHACLDLLMGWEKQHLATGGTLVVDWDTLTARFHRAKERALVAPRDSLSQNGQGEAKSRHHPPLEKAGSAASHH